MNAQDNPPERRHIQQPVRDPHMQMHAPIRKDKYHSQYYRVFALLLKEYATYPPIKNAF